ncbi:MAG TPA: hypothetical protein VMF64_15720 [Steroidobacteraceae bacterium]|nr:hypothetical protein [Steroidobacteraceae bacterium]
MVWHIFKKDFRLLWPLSLAVVVLGALSALRTPFAGHFYGSQLEQLTFYLPYLVYFGIAIVAIAAVHQDTLSESQEDWLVRPLLRRDLALAKLLFVLLTVNVPLLIIDVLLQLALHFPLSVSLGVAASHALFLVLLCSVPALMIGAVTRSLVNAFVFGIASAIAFVFLTELGTSMLSPGVLGYTGFSGLTWIKLWALGGEIAIGSLVALTLQYYTRRTLIARSIGLAAIFAALCMFVLPAGRGTAAIQQALWGPSNDEGIRLSFDPSSQGKSAGPSRDLGYLGFPLSAAAVAANTAMMAGVDRKIETVWLPMSISGMHPGDILAADKIDVRLLSMSGQILYQGGGVCTREGTAVMCSPDRLEVWPSSARVLDKEELNLPIALYQRIKTEPVRVEVSYALTRFVAHPTQMIDAIGGLKALPELGSCATRVDGDGDEVQLGCLTDVGAPSCVALVLEDPQADRRNPALHHCDPQYGPYRRKGSRSGGVVDRVQLSIPFRDLSGLAHYPVGSQEIAHARIDVTVYDPVAHFRTSVTVPSVRLAEWAQPKG